MYRTIRDFERDWTYDIDATSKVFNKLTDESLNQKVSADGRTLGYLAWHIVLTLGEMPGHVGLTVEAPAEDSAAPASAAEIASMFEKTARSLLSEIEANWTDETLLEEDEMYGEKWKRGQTLRALMFHQIHHRGQMTVLMRQAGLQVPGVYGPAKEEWTAMGMPAMQ